MDAITQEDAAERVAYAREAIDLDYEFHRLHAAQLEYELALTEINKAQFRLRKAEAELNKMLEIIVSHIKAGINGLEGRI